MTINSDNIKNIRSTSLNTAKTDPVIINQTDRIQFRFLPKLVNNTNNGEHSIEGTLFYARKGKADSNFPTEAICRKNVHNGECISLNLSTSETYNLYNGLRELYKLYEDIGGVRPGEFSYAKIDSITEQLLSFVHDNKRMLNLLNDEKGMELMISIFNSISNDKTRETLQNVLEQLENDKLLELNRSVNLAKLEKLYRLMHDNLNNNREESWQTTILKENQFIISQLFSCPYVIYQEKAYVGGKV